MIRLLTLLALLALPAAAQQPVPLPGTAATSDQPSDSVPTEQEPTVAPLLGPVGTLFGARDAMERGGLTFALTYLGEVLSNQRGGVRRGTGYEGRAALEVDLDLGRALGMRGARIHGEIYQIHGRGITADRVGNILSVSGIEALPSTRLFELWFQQSVGDTFSLRLGQLAADAEFQVTEYGALFVNSTLGWPASSGANLPSGGPAYPLATPGIRARWRPVEGVTLMAGLFNGDPAGRGEEEAQRRNRDGLRFRLRDDPFLILEARAAWADAALPGTAYLGGWRHFGTFDDLRSTGDGLSLADPDVTGRARLRRGNHGIYAGLDQAVWRDGDAAVGTFLRVAGSPGDRNLVSAYVDGGVVAKGLIPARPGDSAGLAFAYARVGDGARRLDRDVRLFGAPDAPVRSSELLFEATYQAQIVPGFTVQPLVQHVIRPGGGAIAPRADGEAPRRVGNATVLGVRTTVRF